MNKESIRQACLQTLRNRAPCLKYAQSKKTALHLEMLLKDISSKKMRILFYLPMSHEANLVPLMQKMRKRHAIFVPALEQMKLKVVKYRLPLVLNKYKIKEPKSTKSSNESVDIMIVPVIAIDSVFRRIGFGKGVYDRFFASLKTKPIVIFTMPVLCYSARNITQSHDIWGDFFVSSEGIFQKESRHGCNNNNHRFPHSWRSKRSLNLVYRS